MNSKKEGYKKQQYLAAFSFLVETACFVALIFSACMTRSLLVIVDVVDSAAIVLNYVLLFFTSRMLQRNLSWDYNYGIGKIEAIVSIVCDCFTIIGIVITAGYAVVGIFRPEQVSDLLIAVAGLKLVYVVGDLIAYIIQKRLIMKEGRSRVFESELMSLWKELVFDTAGLAALLLVYFLRHYAWSCYLSPVITLLLAVYVLVNAFRHIKSGLFEVLDKSLEEEYQLFFTTLLARFMDRYETFEAVDSRRSGDTTYVDFHLTFTPETTYAQIRELADELDADIAQKMEGCDVNIIIDSAPKPDGREE